MQTEGKERIYEKYNKEEYKKSGIYCLTNKVNKKKYIGQSTNIYNRYKKHLTNSRLKSVQNIILYRAISKYGEDNFELSILEYGTKEELDFLEHKYITKHNTGMRKGKGYNMTTYIQPNIPYYKLTEDSLTDLIKELQESIVLKKVLEGKYNINRQSINNINTGRAYYTEGLDYPLRKESEEAIKNKLRKCFRKCVNTNCSKYYQTKKKDRNKYCSKECYQLHRKNRIPTKDTLDMLKQEYKTISSIGKELGVSDTMVREYFKRYELT